MFAVYLDRCADEAGDGILEPPGQFDCLIAISGNCLRLRVGDGSFEGRDEAKDRKNEAVRVLKCLMHCRSRITKGEFR
jgi:hypothetical protein